MEMEIKRSHRRTLAVQVDRDGHVIVRAPYGIPMSEIERLLEEKAHWISRHVEQAIERSQQGETEEKLTVKQIEDLAKRAKEVIPGRVEYYAGKAGVTYGRITVRNQKTRWGSCSSQGNLNFNCLLMLAPAEVLDYVVVHELCHRKEMNHSDRFWGEVEKLLPDYKIWRTWLKDNGIHLMKKNI